MEGLKKLEPIPKSFIGMERELLRSILISFTETPLEKIEYLINSEGVSDAFVRQSAYKLCKCKQDDMHVKMMERAYPENNPVKIASKIEALILEVLGSEEKDPELETGMQKSMDLPYNIRELTTRIINNTYNIDVIDPRANYVAAYLAPYVPVIMLHNFHTIYNSCEDSYDLFHVKLIGILGRIEKLKLLYSSLKHKYGAIVEFENRCLSAGIMEDFDKEVNLKVNSICGLGENEFYTYYEEMWDRLDVVIESLDSLERAIQRY